MVLQMKYKQSIYLLGAFALGLAACHNGRNQPSPAAEEKVVAEQESVVLIDGHRFVDLALPSGLLWAETNVGAERAADVGDYFAWGETASKESYSWKNYAWGTEECLARYNAADSMTVLAPADDAASVNWGTACRVPTYAEWEELRDSVNCQWTWTTLPNSEGAAFHGFEVKSRRNGHSIFLPASGYRDEVGIHRYGSDGLCWSSTLQTDDCRSAFYIYFGRDGHFWNPYHRSIGISVRAVAKRAV